MPLHKHESLLSCLQVHSRVLWRWHRQGCLLKSRHTSGLMRSWWSVEEETPHLQGDDTHLCLHVTLQEAEARRETVQKSCKSTSVLHHIVWTPFSCSVQLCLFYQETVTIYIHSKQSNRSWHSGLNHRFRTPASHTGGLV